MTTAADEILEGLRPGVGRLEVVEGAGHFPWLDEPEATFGAITRFAEESFVDPTA